MRKSRFRGVSRSRSWILKEGEAGANIAELCCRHEISKESYYRWKAKYGGVEVSEARHLRQFEERGTTG
jgi:putative transposase